MFSQGLNSSSTIWPVLRSVTVITHIPEVFFHPLPYSLCFRNKTWEIRNPAYMHLKINCEGKNEKRLFFVFCYLFEVFYQFPTLVNVPRKRKYFEPIFSLFFVYCNTQNITFLCKKGTKSIANEQLAHEFFPIWNFKSWPHFSQKFSTLQTSKFL